jgi:hypothetical protein
MDRDGDDGLAVLGTQQLGRALEALAQTIAQAHSAVDDRDAHRFGGGAHALTTGTTAGLAITPIAIARRGGSIMCQRGTTSFGRTNSKTWL